MPSFPFYEVALNIVKSEENISISPPARWYRRLISRWRQGSKVIDRDLMLGTFPDVSPQKDIVIPAP